MWPRQMTPYNDQKYLIVHQGIFIFNQNFFTFVLFLYENML